MFRQSTRFDVFLQDSRQDESVRQRVDPGDATDLVASNTNVVSLPVSQELLANISLSSKSITPNGDGINDDLTLEISLVNVLAPRPLRLRLYDLAGRLVGDRSQDSRAGPQEIVWDGRDSHGERVAPGLYVLEVLVEGDAGDAKAQVLVAVAY